MSNTARTDLGSNIIVSTKFVETVTFTGFETVVLGLHSEEDVERRYATAEAAAAGHAAICRDISSRMTGASWRNFRRLATR